MRLISSSIKLRFYYKILKALFVTTPRDQEVTDIYRSSECVCLLGGLTDIESIAHRDIPLIPDLKFRRL